MNLIERIYYTFNARNLAFVLRNALKKVICFEFKKLKDSFKYTITFLILNTNTYFDTYIFLIHITHIYYNRNFLNFNEYSPVLLSMTFPYLKFNYENFILNRIVSA